MKDIPTPPHGIWYLCFFSAFIYKFHPNMLPPLRQHLTVHFLQTLSQSVIQKHIINAFVS